MGRLSRSSLGALPATVARPAYDRSRVTQGVVHLGIGAFHRAHQAVYFDDVLSRGDLGWGIAAASLRSADTWNALAPQDNLYTLAVRDGAGQRLRVIGAVQRVMVAPDDPAALLDSLSDPNIKLVTLTITEKGYCRDPASGDLDASHPDIVHDLKNPNAPRSAIGYLVFALARRRAANVAPFTVLSCDNLPANGETLHRVLTQFARAHDTALAEFIAKQVACPSSMVDRIVPATTDADRDLVAQQLGLDDAWPVMAEPFTQWVIEDRFPAGRPDLGAVGVQLVQDVRPYELMKLRLLNGSHSALAYLGYLSGYETVADAVADPHLTELVRGLMRHEAAPTLPALPGFDLVAYCDALIARFENPALKHRTWQIAMDGSQKLPQRFLGTIRDRLAKDQSIDRLTLGVAAWMRYVTGVNEAGKPIDVRDPLQAELRKIADDAGLDAGRLAPALLNVEAIFGKDLAANAAFVSGVTGALDSLIKHGARETVRRFVVTQSQKG